MFLGGFITFFIPIATGKNTFFYLIALWHNKNNNDVLWHSGRYFSMFRILQSPWNQFFLDNELRLTIKQDVIRTYVGMLSLYNTMWYTVCCGRDEKYGGLTILTFAFEIVIRVSSLAFAYDAVVSALWKAIGLQIILTVISQGFLWISFDTGCIRNIVRWTLWGRPNKAGLKCLSVCTYVRTSVHKCSFSFSDIWFVGRSWCVMHYGMQYDPMQGQGQGHEPLKVGNPSIFNSCLLCHLQWSWQMTTDI